MATLPQTESELEKSCFQSFFSICLYNNKIVLLPLTRFVACFPKFLLVVVNMQSHNLSICDWHEKSNLYRSEYKMANSEGVRACVFSE